MTQREIEKRRKLKVIAFLTSIWTYFIVSLDGFVYFPWTLNFIGKFGQKSVLCTGADPDFVQLKPYTISGILFKEKEYKNICLANLKKKYMIMWTLPLPVGFTTSW